MRQPLDAPGRHVPGRREIVLPGHRRSAKPQKYQGYFS
jgi:hypothetical protein